MTSKPLLARSTGTGAASLLAANAARADVIPGRGPLPVRLAARLTRPCAPMRGLVVWDRGDRLPEAAVLIARRAGAGQVDAPGIRRLYGRPLRGIPGGHAPDLIGPGKLAQALIERAEE